MVFCFVFYLEKKGLPLPLKDSLTISRPVNFMLRAADLRVNVGRESVKSPIH